MTILIVEDHKAVRRLIRREIEGLATEVLECDNGAEAALIYSLHRPDVVLMDIQLPGVDGLATTRRIKQAHPDARVIFVTDYDQSEFRSAAAELGVSGYVTKSDLSPLKGLVEQAVL
jgi:CheY-like chemotaxis protein